MLDNEPADSLLPLTSEKHYKKKIKQKTPISPKTYAELFRISFFFHANMGTAFPLPYNFSALATLLPSFLILVTVSQEYWENN